jgi:hypothetical protein
MRSLSKLKSFLVPPGIKPRRILAGPFKGIEMNLSLEGHAQIYAGLFEKETHPWVRRLSRDLRTAIDIGAAHGEYTLFFLKKTKARKIYAFEPDLSWLPVLRENLRLNGFDPSERLDLSTKFVGISDSGSETRLDSLVDSIQPPCLVKVDVDGAEEQILIGAQMLNTRPGVRWLIETHSAALEAACVELLSSAGFRTRIIRNAWWRVLIPELRPIPHNRWLAAWKAE